jgi:O-antigen ligase
VAVLVTVLVLGGATLAFVELRSGHVVEKRLTTLAGWNKLTGGRAYLVRGGWLMFRRHPQGIGLAGFPLAYHLYRQYHRVSGGVIRPLGPANLTESHSTPVTVLAEQGVEGAVAFAAIIVVYFGTALRTARLQEDQRLRLLQAGFMAVVLAVLLHSCLYNAFFEDPYLWTVMAMSMALRYVVAARVEAPEGAVAPERSVGAPAGEDELIPAATAP